MLCYNIAIKKSFPMFVDLEDAFAGTRIPLNRVIDSLPFDSKGLLPVIVQAFDTKDVLMLAWMNRAAIAESLETQRACYWSRSRQELWRKGESSGCTQLIREVRLDCDGDTLLLLVDQTGAACHTGRNSCFYLQLDRNYLVVLSSKQQVMEKPL
jgi:phosphoribosyl-AMP cyclohydrolase